MENKVEMVAQQNTFKVRQDNAKKMLVVKLSQERQEKIRQATDVVLLVSVGTDNFNEEALAAQIKSLKSLRDSCDVLVADELQWFNLSGENNNLSDEAAQKRALKQGDEWVNTSEDIIKKNNFTITRWKHWISHEKFNTYKQKISEALATNTLYEKSMIVSIEKYKNRIQKRKKEEGSQQALTLLTSKENVGDYYRNYLIEECAVFMVMASQVKKGTVMVYPNKPQEVIEKTYELFIRPEYGDSLEWIDTPLKRKTVSAMSDMTHVKLTHKLQSFGQFRESPNNKRKKEDVEEVILLYMENSNLDQEEKVAVLKDLLKKCENKHKKTSFEKQK